MVLVLFSKATALALNGYTNSGAVSSLGVASGAMKVSVKYALFSPVYERAMPAIAASPLPATHEDMVTSPSTSSKRLAVLSNLKRSRRRGLGARPALPFFWY